MSNRSEYIQKIIDSLGKLKESQLALIDDVVEQLARPFIKIERSPGSDFVDECLLYTLGDFIRVHHGFSIGPFTKDKFEYAQERAENICGVSAQLATAGNRGHDITVRGNRISLKTEAEKAIKNDLIHISKYMELGGGKWGDSEDDLRGLRKQFLEHLKGYERIFSLRCLLKGEAGWHYELIEIPKSLLLEARTGELEMRYDSTQFPKPGYCHIRDEAGNLKFQLYFDGGGERKLQIKNLDKQYCIYHASWTFLMGESSGPKSPLQA